MKFFNNVTFPAGVVYNINGNVQYKCRGGADVEHHQKVDGEDVVWFEKFEDKKKCGGEAEVSVSRVSTPDAQPST